MRVELKDFQAGAVATLANKLQSMCRRYEQDGELSSVCLASPTGSVPISRRKRQEFNQNFNAYLGR